MFRWYFRIIVDSRKKWFADSNLSHVCLEELPIKGYKNAKIFFSELPMNINSSVTLGF